MSKTYDNCATISCYVIDKAFGVVGRCLLWQKSESGWDTVNFVTTLYELCIIFKVCKNRSKITFCLTTKYWIGSLPFFLKCVEEFQIDLGIFFISKIIKMHNFVISKTLANKAPKVSRIMGLFLEKLKTFITFRKLFWKSLKNTIFF